MRCKPGGGGVNLRPGCEASESMNIGVVKLVTPLAGGAHGNYLVALQEKVHKVHKVHTMASKLTLTAHVAYPMELASRLAQGAAQRLLLRGYPTKGATAEPHGHHEAPGWPYHGFLTRGRRGDGQRPRRVGASGERPFWLVLFER